MSHSTIINLKSLKNTRDLGGIYNYHNKKIKDKMILRSGNLSKASKEDMEILRDQYNLRTIIDLRTEHEQMEQPDVLVDGIKVISNPILTEAQMGITKENDFSSKQSNIRFVNRHIEKNDAYEFMKDLYLDFVNNPYCLTQYTKFIKILLDNEDGAVLYHCSVGKDRVGIATYIILSLLDVKESDIVEDFMLTNYLIEDSINEEIDALREDIPNSKLEETYRKLFMVQKGYIEAILSFINTSYGSFFDFRRDILKISDEEAKRFKEKFLED